MKLVLRSNCDLPSAIGCLMEHATNISLGRMTEISDLSFPIVERGDRLYMLIYNLAHDYVVIMFGEDLHYNPDEDTLTVVEGFVANYAKFNFRVAKSRFVDDLTTVTVEKVSSVL
jgi:hypothetical protein